MCKFNMFITAVCFLFLIILIHILGRKITEGGKAGRASNNPPPTPDPRPLLLSSRSGSVTGHFIAELKTHKKTNTINCGLQITGLPRCKNLRTFSLFCSYC